MLLSRQRWFGAGTHVGVWWLAHCAGFAVEDAAGEGPRAFVEDVGQVEPGGRAVALLVRYDGLFTQRRGWISVDEVAGVDPERRTVLLRRGLRTAIRRSRRAARGFARAAAESNLAVSGGRP